MTRATRSPCLDGKSFPRALGGLNVPADVRRENTGGSTVYADPFGALNGIQ